jgi:hypothetical protein
VNNVVNPTRKAVIDPDKLRDFFENPEIAKAPAIAMQRMKYSILNAMHFGIFIIRSHLKVELERLEKPCLQIY